MTQNQVAKVRACYCQGVHSPLKSEHKVFSCLSETIFVTKYLFVGDNGIIPEIIYKINLNQSNVSCILIASLSNPCDSKMLLFYEVFSEY